MFPLHYITITVFVHESEDIDIYKEILERFLPDDFDKQKATLKQEELHIQEDQSITSLQLHTTTSKYLRYIVSTLKERLGSKVCEEISSQTNRVDEKGRFYLRLDKKKMVENDKPTIVEHGDCIHFKLMIAAHPKTKQRSEEIIKELLA
ncbi:MAG: RNA-binding domain-containing protein [Nanobdellota archaeon]